VWTTNGCTKLQRRTTSHYQGQATPRIRLLGPSAIGRLPCIQATRRQCSVSDWGLAVWTLQCSVNFQAATGIQPSRLCLWSFPVVYGWQNLCQLDVTGAAWPPAEGCQTCCGAHPKQNPKTCLMFQKEVPSPILCHWESEHEPREAGGHQWITNTMLPGIHFCYRLSWPQAIVWLEGLGKLKKFHLIGIWSRDLPACSIIPIWKIILHPANHSVLTWFLSVKNLEEQTIHAVKHIQVHLELLGLRNLSIIRYSKKLEDTKFWNRICFLPQVRGETLAMLGPLERANPNHWWK
jgi:hypothetical protein